MIWVFVLVGLAFLVISLTGEALAMILADMLNNAIKKGQVHRNPVFWGLMVFLVGSAALVNWLFFFNRF